MKKPIFFLSLLLMCYYFSNAQDSISFNMHYLPMHKYEQTVLQQFTSTTTFSGSDSILNALKQQGVTNPMITNKNLNVRAVTITGAYNDSDEMPIQLTYEDATDKDGNIIIPKGAGFVGTVQRNKMPNFDSIVLPDQNDIQTKTTLNQVKNIFQQIHLPNSRMKLGDEYVYNTSINIPMPGITMKGVISIIYKLINVTDSFANFNLVMKVNFDVGMDKATVKNATGSGNGTLIYDRFNEFPIKENLNYTMIMDVGNNEKSIEVKLISNSSHNYIITKL